MILPAIQTNDAPGAGLPAPRDEADEATRGSAVKLAAEMAGRAVGLATTLLIARGLGVSDFGLFAALSGIAVIVAEAGDLGLHVTASRALVAETLSLRSMVRARLALTVLVVALAAVLGLASPLFIPLILYFALAGWSEFLGVALRARGARGGEAALILALRASGLVLVAVSVVAGAGLPGLVWAQAASPLPAVALGWLLVRRTRAEGGPGADAGILPILRESLPLAVNGALALLSLRVELLLLAALRGSREAGYFAAALRVVEFLNVVPSAVSAGAMPALTREGIRGEGPVRGRTAGTVALLAAPAAAGVALVAPEAATGLFGAEFAPAAAPLRILALSVVVLFMNSVLLHSLIAVGRGEWLPRLTAVRVSMALVLAWALIPGWGGAGAATGFLVAEATLLVLASRACAAARFGVPVARPLALALLVSVPMSAAVALVGAPLAISVGLGAAIYGATLLAAWRVAPWLLP